jgi:hypothetical protein
MFTIIKLERHDIAETLLKLALNTNQAIIKLEKFPVFRNNYILFYPAIANWKPKHTMHFSIKILNMVFEYLH